MRVQSISTSVLLRMVSPLRCSLMFLAFVMSSKSFSTLPMTRSPSPIVMTKARSPRSKANPSFFGFWRWLLRGGFFVHGNLREMQVLAGHRVRSFGWVEGLLGSRKARRSVLNSWISLAGVLVVKSSSMRFSFNFFSPCCMESASCIWKPNHIWPIMSMPRVAIRCDFVCDGGVGLLSRAGVDVAL